MVLEDAEHLDAALALTGSDLKGNELKIERAGKKKEAAEKKTSAKQRGQSDGKY